jgi:hypothetical protein
MSQGWPDHRSGRRCRSACGRAPFPLAGVVAARRPRPAAGGRSHLRGRAQPTQPPSVRLTTMRVDIVDRLLDGCEGPVEVRAGPFSRSGCGRSPSAFAAASFAAISTPRMSASPRIATRSSPEIVSLRNLIWLRGCSGSKLVTPVTLSPGRSRSVTSPVFDGIDHDREHDGDVGGRTQRRPHRHGADDIHAELLTGLGSRPSQPPQQLRTCAAPLPEPRMLR